MNALNSKRSDTCAVIADGIYVTSSLTKDNNFYDFDVLNFNSLREMAFQLKCLFRERSQYIIKSFIRTSFEV